MIEYLRSSLVIPQSIAISIDLAAAAIAVIALVFSVRATIRQRSIEIEHLRILRDNDIIKWSNEAIDVLSEVQMLLRAAESHLQPHIFADRKFSSLAKISSSIDKGRLYFPNEEDGVYGLDKESAYRGARQAILTYLVDTYDLLKVAEQDETLAQRRTIIVDLKRAFVSEVQSKIEPKRRAMFLRS